MKVSKYFWFSIKYVYSKNKLSYLYTLLNMVAVAETFFTLLAVQMFVNTFFSINDKTILYANIIKLLLYLSVIVLIKLVSFVKSVLRTKINNKLNYDFNYNFLEKASDIKWEYYESYEYSNLIYQVKSRSLSSIIQCFDSFLSYINSVLLLAIYCFFLSRINVFLALLYLVVVVLLNLYSKQIMLKIGDVWSEIDVLTKKQQYFLNVSSDKIKHQEYLINDLFDYFYRKWENCYDEEQEKRIDIFRKSEILNRISRIVLYAPYILMMFFVAYQIVLGNYEIGFLILCMDMFNEIINTIGSVKDNFVNSVVSAKYVKSYIDYNNFEITVKKPFTQGNDYAISLQNISYTYPQSEKKAIDNVSLWVNHGDKISILGENGSGKTTLVNIISGMVDIKDGEVSISSKTSVIYQDFIHYQLSIKDNIQFGNSVKTLTDEEIFDLLEKVGLKTHVESLPDGIYTNLGQLLRGSDLSKGQWQRIAIARLLANENAEIWILDEPTAYLDPLSEINLYNMINSFAENRTVIYISHRLGFAKNSNKIIILEDGKIIESGTHKELMQQNGKYSALYNEQVKYTFGE
jgi:ABC-type bacteriocin/lantibiotic exporters, contain an N-terminal double-glycine peptidase domain